ncbi:MAG: permease-like cell division protein FtsX [Gammaproteobacteria bacterium]|nr:permease-like cell division protein FtsX [Gammaproteobacteria bacterium]
MKKASTAKESKRQRKPGVSTLLGSYLLRHAQTLIYSLGQLLRTPFSLLMTTAVIGIALALPTGLQVVLKNAELLSGKIDSAAQISLFLKKGASEAQAKQLAERLEAMPEISKVHFINKQAALKEFKQNAGFAEAMQALKENPLPHVIVIQPSISHTGETTMQKLLGRLQNMLHVDVAQLDEEWIKRLYTIMDFIKRGVWLLGSMLGLAVLLVVGNTIRLAIQNRRDEIVIVKLIGGTDAFIRRPFLYTGFWYGLFGALIAFILISIALLLLNDPIERLAQLYYSDVLLSSLDFQTTLALFGSGIVLGLAGSWLAVSRHLRDIEPK